jgi:hypothetical protein
MEILLVADTNLFFECKSLDQLPWSELGCDPVVILLTKPVLDEIDKHKKANGRTRARALEIFGQVRGMLTSAAQEVEIRSSSPKVVLRRMTNVKPDPAFKDDLDYTKTDERLVGIVSALNAQASASNVKLFTDDTGPATTADGLGVPYLMINENWRRPPSETTEDKKIKELEKDLATYRAQEPKISIGACDMADESNVVEIRQKVATPLTDIEIERILDKLRLKHPLVTDFTPPPSSITTAPSGEITTTEYSSPSEDAISQYCDVAYPQWIDECRKILEKLHEGRSEIAPPVVLRWPMANIGTRPASQVRIEFEAKGPLKLLRVHAHKEDESDTVVIDGSVKPSAVALTKFPSAPKPPLFQKQVTRTAPPSKPKLTTGFDISTLRAAGALDERYRGIGGISKAMGLGHSDIFSQHLKGLNAATEAARLLQRGSGILGPSHLDAFPDRSAFAMIQPIEPLNFPRPYIPEPHDPESFYYDWPPNKGVERGALTCDLWRHQAGNEVFEFVVLFTREGEARGTVECTVHAENLTKPEQARVIVSRIIEPLSIVDLVDAMVEACN